MLTELMLPLLLGCAPKIEPTVIPAAELIQQDHGHTHGPEETKGIESVEALGSRAGAACMSASCLTCHTCPRSRG